MHNPPPPHTRARVSIGKHKKRKTIVFSSKLEAIEKMADWQVEVGDEKAHESGGADAESLTGMPLVDGAFESSIGEVDQFLCTLSEAL